MKFRKTYHEVLGNGEDRKLYIYLVGWNSQKLKILQRTDAEDHSKKV